MWKSRYTDLYPLKWSIRNNVIQERRTRSAVSNRLNEAHGCNILNSTFVNDTVRIWNKAPDNVKKRVPHCTRQKRISSEVKPKREVASSKTVQNQIIASLPV